MVKICQTGFLKLNFETRPKKRIFRFSGDTVSQSRWYFRPSFVNCCPSNLLSVSPLPPFPVLISILYTRIWCVRGGGIGGYRVLGLRKINTCRKIPSHVVVARHLFLLCFPPRPSRDLLFLTHVVHM